MTRNVPALFARASAPPTLLLAALAALGLGSFAPAAHGQGYTVQNLADLTGSGPTGDGAYPYGSLTLDPTTDLLYGVASQGGADNDGDVFSFDPSTNAVTDIGDFTTPYNGTGGNGNGPSAALLDVGGTLYGTAYGGGANGYGDVFSVGAVGAGQTGTITDIADFTGYPGNGANSRADLTLVGTTLYGTTENGGQYGDGPPGGPYGYGNIFSVALPTTPGGTSAINDVFDFTNAPSDNGANPFAGLTNVNGTLYGTTEYGGPNNYGNVFAYTPGGGVTDVADFPGTAPDYSQSPISDLVNVNGTLYGATQVGGAYGDGELFSVTTSGALTDVADLNFRRPNDTGANPLANLLLVGDTLYGTAQFGGTSDDGTVFAYNTDTGSLTNVASFTDGAPDKGRHPFGGLVEDNGILYGTTLEGGTGSGNIYSLTPNVSPTPEPSQLGLLALTGAGLGGLLLRARRKNA